MAKPSRASDATAAEGVGLPGATVQVTFVVVSLALVLLLVLPLVVRQRSDDIRREATEVAEPARDLAEDIERDLAVQVAAARGFALGREPHLLVRYRSAGADADTALLRLAAPAEALGPEVAAAVGKLRSSLAAWQRNSAAQTPAIPTTLARLTLEQRLFEATIADATRVDAAIGSAVDRRRREAQLVDRAAAIMTAVLLALVLASVVLLARLAAQLRRLAEVSRTRALHEQQLRRELEQAMDSRARLIRGFSHDVRNPLGAADGYAQLLESGVYGDLADKQFASVVRIRRSIGAAVVLTDDLLDLARLEAGDLQVERMAVDVAVVAAETAEEYRAQAEAVGHRMEVQAADSPVRVDSDARRIHQVLGNLLSNAIKYTPEPGSVGMRVSGCASGAEGAPRAGRWVAVAVSDTGIGIPPEQRARIFDEFARAVPHAARGAGLGLTISRRLARALGGDITLESEPGAGSTFTLWLPCE